MAPRVHIVIVGLGFGAEFIPLYSSHPGVGRVALCDPNPEKLADHLRRYNIEDGFLSLEEALEPNSYNAVHLVTPPGLHAAQASKVLRSGRHCASAVPMALSIDEIEEVIAAAQSKGMNYMMMETSAYHRSYLYARALYDAGRLGELTFMRGAHYRDRTEMPEYWRGFPPMKYATHVISPLLAILDTRATGVSGLGSGRLAETERFYDQPFPIETCIISLADTDAKAEVTQACFSFARPSSEAFSFYGDAASVEWPQFSEEEVYVHTMGTGGVDEDDRFRRIDSETVIPPDRNESLPGEIREYTTPSLFTAGPGLDQIPISGGHGGSHPHLVHEFVSSILEQRPSRIDEYTAADWCAPGILAHESAMAGGRYLEVPDFKETFPRRR
jgi:predicted dehydrogenase